MTKFYNILSKFQNYILALAIILCSFAISIKFGDGKVNLILQNYPLLIFLMVVISTLLIVLYIQTDKKRISNLSNQIKVQSTDKSEDYNVLLGQLTMRQKEVYDLIISGKTNKEIVSELFIEQSTLKSHINQIYRKLNIQNRKELKSRINR